MKTNCGRSPLGGLDPYHFNHCSDVPRLKREMPATARQVPHKEEQQTLFGVSLKFSSHPSRDVDGICRVLKRNLKAISNL